MIFLLKRLLALSLCIFSFACLAAEPLDLNTATADQLALALSGVGQSKAEAIVAYRDQNGPFMNVDDLTKVKGIGPALLDKNRMILQIKQPE